MGKTRGALRTASAILTVLVLALVPGRALSQANEDPQQESSESAAERRQMQTEIQAGRTGETGAGEVGQRQTDQQISPDFEALGRISTRIENRVQNRIRSRIDRDYDPQANALSPFERASEETRTPGDD